MRPWTIGIGDDSSFDVYQTDADRRPHSDAALNGTYPTKAAALRAVIASAETERLAIARKLRRARTMLRRAERASE